MDRREFLRRTVRGRERVVELSCERLYMRWVDARAAGGVRGEDGAQGLAVPWEGEPPLDVVVPTTERLLDELERCLAAVDVLEVTGREWLADERFGEQVESRIEAFLHGGGRVE